MRPLDSNVVLRLLMRDDPAQANVAEMMFTQPVLLTRTVLLETAWVLGSRYRLARTQVAGMLAALVDRSTVTIDAPAQFAWAIDRFRSGGDLADLIHIVAGRGATRFATFDAGVAPAAGSRSPVPVETLTF